MWNIYFKKIKQITIFGFLVEGLISPRRVPHLGKPKFFHFLRILYTEIWSPSKMTIYF